MSTKYDRGMFEHERERLWFLTYLKHVMDKDPITVRSRWRLIMHDTRKSGTYMDITS